MQEKLYFALQSIAKFLEVTLSGASPKAKEISLEEWIYQTMSDSKIALRKVVLKGNWWKNSAEPLLCFYKDKGLSSGCALIPTFFGRYFLVETPHKKRLLTQKESLNLDIHAFAFYPPLPKNLHTPSDIFFFSLKGAKNALLVLGILTLCISVLALLPLFAVQWILNHIFDKGGPEVVWQIALGLMIASFSSSLFLYFRNRILLRLNGYFANHLQPTLWNQLFQLKAAFFQKITKGELFQKVMGFEGLRTGLKGTAAEVIFSSFFSLIYLAAMAFFSLPLTLLALLGIGAIAWIFFSLKNQKIRLKTKIQNSKTRRVNYLQQSLFHLIKVRAASQEKLLLTHWKKKLEGQLDKEKKLDRILLFLDLIAWALPFVHLVVILSFITAGWPQPPLGNLCAFYLALFYLSDALKDLIHFVLEIQAITPLLKQSEKFFEEPQETSQGKALLGKGNIQWKNLSFRYGKETNFILHHLSEAIAPQEKVGLVGAPGCGKTTLLRLLLGIESPEEGEILFDEEKLSHLNIKLVRRQMGAVFGTEGLFASTLYMNITAGRPCNLAQIERALDLADFRQDLESFPMGLYTAIPEDGSTLSRGQIQRLLIARALVFNPSVLLLDQPFDSLDPLSTRKILKNLHELPITQILIAPREILEGYVDRIIELPLHRRVLP